MAQSTHLEKIDVLPDDDADNDIFMLKMKHCRMKSKTPDSDPKVTVTIPRSHLEFLNMVFPPSPQSSDEIQDADEDMLVTTLDESAGPRVDIPPLSNDFQDTSQQHITSKLKTNLTSTGPFTVPGTSATEQPEQRAQNSETEQDEHDKGMNEFDASSETISSINEILPDTPSCKEVKNKGNAKSHSKDPKKRKRSTKSLTFPPCNVCGGKSSGLHYGVNSCEACKGFFRRYLHKQVLDYKCNMGGNCEIIKRNRTNCSGCRLKKCLALGMSKDKVQMGRYTLTKRTETINNMNKMKMNDVEVITDDESSSNSSSQDVSSEMVGRQCCQTSNLNQSKNFSQALVDELTQAVMDMKPFGLDVVSDEIVEEKLKSHSEHYQSMIKLYGEMKPVPKDEYYKLYRDYSIDVDGRMEELKKCFEGIDQSVASYCNFAKHIPGFHKLPFTDQSNLLKTSRGDVFILFLHKGYNAALQVFLDNNGRGYHIDQCAGKFMTRDAIMTMMDVYEQWQKLYLSWDEIAILMAIVLMYPDRCKIEQKSSVEFVQQSLANLLMDVLRKTHKKEASKRFTKMVDLITNMRNCTELYLDEYRELCNDKVLVEEFPLLPEFLPDT